MKGKITKQELKDFLEEKYELYDRPRFIQDDPVAIPHEFTAKEDIEIAGFLTAIIAWGNRKSILNNARELLRRTDFAPAEFIRGADESDFEPFNSFVHRTFNGSDCLFFMRSLQNIYRHYGGLERVFTEGYLADQTVKSAIVHFRSLFFSIEHPQHALKHIADPSKNASAKRLNMFLRWMVRKDQRDVDFGLWNGIPASSLHCPLDVHTGNVGRKLGLLQRNANDWKAVEELTGALRRFDPDDPVKYDYALFGLGIYEGF